MKLCTGNLKILDNHHHKTASYRRHEIENRSNLRNAISVNVFASYEEVRPIGVKRLKLKCPKCGRKVTASVRMCSDGCCLYQVLPPHKPKRWWKKRRH